MQTTLVETGKSFHTIAFGDWQLQYHLPIECAQKSIEISPYLKSYINYLTLTFQMYGAQSTALFETPQDLAQIFAIKTDKKLSATEETNFIMAEFYAKFMS